MNVHTFAACALDPRWKKTIAESVILVVHVDDILINNTDRDMIARADYL